MFSSRRIARYRPLEWYYVRPDMPTLYQQIGKKFLAELAKSKEVSAHKLEALRPLFADDKKLKADDLVNIFTSAEEDEVK